jgi:hypothetical protein
METIDVSERRNVWENRKSPKDIRYKRKSRKSQKAENEHKQSKNFKCSVESKATEQPKSITETAEQEPGRAKERRSKPAESKKQFPGTRSLFSGRESIEK